MASLWFARLKYVLWAGLTKGLLGLICVVVSSEGLRYLVPALGQKLYKIPGLAALKNYEGTYRLDLAPILAVFILIAVWWLWDRILKLWLLEREDEASSRWNRTNVDALTVWLGLVVIGADLCLFYVAMTRVGWQGSTFSLPAFLATLAYVAVLIFVSFVSITLSQQIVELRKEVLHVSA